MSNRTVDLFLVYEFIKRLSTPFNETEAYNLNLIDKDGKRLKKASTREEKDAMSYFNRLIFNLKRLLGRVGVYSKIGSFAAALLLMRESTTSRTDIITEWEFMEFIRENRELVDSLIQEEVAANNVGGGAIAGASPGEDPPVHKRVLNRLKKKNKNSPEQTSRKVFNQIRVQP